MADTTTAGRHRTALALRQLEELDFEATGQLPAPYNPKRQIATKVLKETGKIAGKGTVLAAKGLWGATKYVFAPRPSRSIHIIIQDRSDPFCTIVLCVALAVVVLLGVAGLDAA